jgi:hypothetical protein
MKWTAGQESPAVFLCAPHGPSAHGALEAPPLAADLSARFQVLKGAQTTVAARSRQS